MSKFIEVIQDVNDESVLINQDYIFKVECFNKEKSTIYVMVTNSSNNHIRAIVVKHSYLDIKKMLMDD